jgi:hypothetical protein
MKGKYSKKTGNVDYIVKKYSGKDISSGNINVIQEQINDLKTIHSHVAKYQDIENMLKAGIASNVATLKGSISNLESEIGSPAESSAPAAIGNQKFIYTGNSADIAKKYDTSLGTVYNKVHSGLIKEIRMEGKKKIYGVLEDAFKIKKKND